MYHHPAAPRNSETMTTAMTFGSLIISPRVATSCRFVETGVNTSSSGSSSTRSGTRTASRTSSSCSSMTASFTVSTGSGSSSSIEIVVSSSSEKTTSSSTASSTVSASDNPTSLRDKPASRRRSTNSAFLPDVARSLMTHRALSLATVSDDVSSAIRSPRLIRWLIPYQGWWSMRQH